MTTVCIVKLKYSSFYKLRFCRTFSGIIEYGQYRQRILDPFLLELENLVLSVLYIELLS